jgi:hypothetical protein
MIAISLMGISAAEPSPVRGSFRRLLRTTVFRVIDLGVLGAAARALSVLDRRRGLYLRGRVLGIADRRADLTDYWRAASGRFPADMIFVRESIHSALRAGRLVDAKAGLDVLVRLRTTLPGDCNYVVGLVNAYQMLGEERAIRGVVREFLKSFPDGGPRRIAALKLCRIIFAHFRGIGEKDAVGEHLRIGWQFGRMLDRSEIDPAPRALLTRVVSTGESLAKDSSLALLDTDVSEVQCKALVGLVNERLVHGEPFSLVRIGDGEAACLPYEPKLSGLAKADAIDRERIWWGNPLTAGQRARMSRLVFNATWSADCIGIPAVSRFLRELRLDTNDHLDRGLTGRGLRAILYSAERYKTFRGADASPPSFTSCHIHQDLERWGLYPELLGGRRDVVLVSCHPDLAELVKSRFNARIAASLVLPADRVSAPALKFAAPDRRRLPDILDEVEERMSNIPKGSLVLVGAGYLGKWLVDVARAKGGIALDVGSVFDYWLGLATRSYLDLNPVR